MGKRVLGLASVAVLVAIAANPALANGRGKLATNMRAVPIDQQRLLYDPPAAHLDAMNVGPRADTTFFGGNSGAGGLATINGVWDFEGGNLQGWSSRDLTVVGPTGGGPFIRRSTDADFTSGGDPVNGVIDPAGAPDHIASIWVGAHEDEASLECWPGGQGYGNGWGVYARKTFTYGGSGNVTLEFDYYSDSETGFDFTYVYSVRAGIRSAPYNTSANPDDNGFGYSGANEEGTGIGTPTNPAHDQMFIPVGDLPGSGQPFDVLVNFDSDPLFADGLDSTGLFLNSWFGPFCFDNFSILGTSLSDTDNFETGLDGWTLFSDPAIGTLLRVRNLDVLDPVEDPCTCPITSDPSNDFVMLAADETGVGFPHPKRQHEEIRSNSAYVGNIGQQSIKVTLWDVWQDLPNSNGVGYRAVLHYYPWTCAETGTVGWTLEPAGDGGFIFNGLGGSAVCTTFIADNSEFLPTQVESLKVVWELLGDCDDFGTQNCTGPEQTNQSPYWDNIQIGLSGIDADAPTVSNDTAQYQDIGPTANTLAHTATAKMVSFFDNNRADTDQTNAIMGDSTVVLAASATGRGTQVFMNLRVYPGPGINTSGATWLAWRNDARFVAGSNPLAPNWAKARMDTAESVTGPTAGKYSSYFWPNGQENKNTSKILPNGLFTPGTTIEYFYTGQYNNSPPGDQTFFPDTTGKFFFEVEVLPSYRRSTAGGPFLAPCVLYVDAFNAGSQVPIETYGLTQRLGRQAQADGLVRNRWDRYDYIAASSNVPAPLAREAAGDNGMTKYQTYVYRSILFNSGNFSGEALRNGDADLLINWLTNTDFSRQNFQKGLWLSGNQIASILDNPERSTSQQLLSAFAAVSVPLDDSYLEQTGDSTMCVRLDAVSGRHFGTAGSYSSAFGNGCPALLSFNVLSAIGGAGGVGNLNYVNQDEAGTPVTSFASVSNNKFTVGQGNYGVVTDAFSLHLLRQTPAGWTGEDCGADTSFIESAIFTRVNDVFNWFGVPTGSAILKDPASIIVGVDESEPVAGIRTALFQNTPNPFNPRTTVRYQLGTKSHVTLGIFDVTGRLVRTLVDKAQVAGEYTIAWDGSTDAGEAVSSGVYWARMNTADGFEASTKMVVLK